METTSASMKTGESRIFTDAVHGGEDPGSHQGALSVPVYRSAVYRFEDPDSAHNIHEGHEPGYFYGRMGTPTQTAFENAVATLEQGEAALAFASGMASISSLLMTVLKPGDHVIGPRTLYASTRQLLFQMLQPNGIQIDLVDETDPAAWRGAVRDNTRVIYAETPSNPLLTVTDLDDLASLAREHGLLSIVDNTFATPFNQRPLAMGIDAVVHSATKYLGGHGDLLGGLRGGQVRVDGTGAVENRQVAGRIDFSGRRQSGASRYQDACIADAATQSQCTSNRPFPR